jgi:hypothetical protein
MEKVTQLKVVSLLGVAAVSSCRSMIASEKTMLPRLIELKMSCGI